MTSFLKAAVCFASLVPSAVLAACSETYVDLRGDWGQARFNVEVAQSSKEIAVGLMNRPTMPATAGMIFVYPKPRRVHFWMKNTLIPLDMVFLSGDGTVQKIHENAIPLDETPIFGGDDIQYVLEINGGMAATIGITEGSELRHPAVIQDGAAWPCE